MNNFKKGFTLIELLVVVGIIGILAAVVLVSLSSAKARGVNAAVKNNLSEAHVQAALFYDTGLSYEAVCAVSGTNTIGSFVNAAERAYKGSVTSYADATPSLYNTAQCHDSTNAWVAIVPLKESTSASPLTWCVDSTGISKQITNTLLDWTFVCPS